MEIAYLAPKERGKGRRRGSFPDDNDTKGHNLGVFCEMSPFWDVEVV